ncbi:TPA: hypothetical protein ACPWS4_003964 [Pseudomonas aeruginosa]
MATIFAGGSAPELAQKGYLFKGTVDGTDEQVLAAYAEQDVCLVRGAAISGNGKDGQWEFGVMTRSMMPNRNEQFLSAIDGKAKAMILESIAAHYGISPDDAYTEVTGAEAEHLLDYMVEPQRSAASVLMQRHGMA